MSKEALIDIDTNFYKHVSSRLLALRESLGLRRNTVVRDIEQQIQQTYDKNFKFHPTLLMQYESGKIKIPLARLKMMADYYGYPIEKLIPNAFLEIKGKHSPELTEIQEKLSSITSEIVLLNSIVSNVKANTPVNNNQNLTKKLKK